MRTGLGVIGAVVVASLVSAGCGEKEEETDGVIDDCPSYCAAIFQSCPDTFADSDECLNACADYPTREGANDKASNTFACRATHLGYAADSPDLHCPHAGPDGAEVCIDSTPECLDYCSLVMEGCSDQFATDEDCWTACERLPADGATDDVTGNTVQCRTTSAKAAARDPSRCEEAAIESTTCTASSGP